MRVSILGCGVYGLALANTFFDNGNEVVCFSKFDKEVLELRVKYLNFCFTSNLGEAIDKADLLVIAIPIAFLGETMISLKEVYKGQDILIASKGIDTKDGKFAYEIVRDCLEDAPIGVISGGTFADDMSNKWAMGITLGTKIERIKDKVRKSLENNFLRVQYTNDIVGVSVSGAIKNVMAIGFGMLDGAGYPPSSRFLFLTEAIYEIRDLIVALGGDKETVISYAGIDDIMMTCTSSNSRNYTMGSMIGKRLDSEEINEYKNNTTIEGLGTSKAIYELAMNMNLNLPISKVIYSILYEDADINELVKVLEKRES